MITPDPTESENACVLIIDDDINQRLLTLECVEQSGVDVIEASSGEEGLRLAREDRPDIILLDVVIRAWMASMFAGNCDPTQPFDISLS